MPAIPHCARPGCGGPGAAWLTYDYRAGSVWIDPPDGEADGTQLALCEPHADRLRVPVGWTCADRRPAAPGAPPDPDGPDPGSARAAVAV